MGKKNRANLKLARKRLKPAVKLSILKRAVRANKKRKQLKQARETPRTFQIASFRKSSEVEVSKEKMLELAEKLQKKYFKAKKDMCSSCKGHPLTTIHTSFKMEGKEEKIEMRALIVDLEKLADAGIPEIEEYLNPNLN